MNTKHTFSDSKKLTSLITKLPDTYKYTFIKNTKRP